MSLFTLECLRCNGTGREWHDVTGCYRRCACQTSAAAAETERALIQVDQHADQEWKQQALAAVERTCLLLPEFISDDVWTTGGLNSTREDRALGPIFQQAKRLGWCVKTDRVRPSVRSHLSGKPVWSSRLHRTPA